MKRTAFRRRPPLHEPSREREPRPMAKPERWIASSPVADSVVAVPKDGALESAAYENAVRSLGYCVRCGLVGRPQFCHRDAGKGFGIKTDVRQGWAGCDGCHAWLGGHKGGGRMPKDQRRAEEDQLAAITRAEVLRRGLWPKSVPTWIEGGQK
jgi:hypothetical protein